MKRGLLLLLQLASGASVMAQGLLGFGALEEPEPPQVYAEVAQYEVAAGGQTVLQVYVTPAVGWHLYSVVPQGNWAPEPTRLPLLTPWLQPVGALQETPPETLADAAYQADLLAHTQPFELKQALQLRADAPPGEQTAFAQLVYQACNQKICLPPQTQDVAIALKVRP